MTIINHQVAKSSDIHAAALNLNAKVFEVRQTLAGVWDLKPSATAPPPLESTFQLDMKNPSDESVFGERDERVKVAEKHYMPGGKYRSIVKLFIHYEFQEPGKWAMGTGWLVKPDVFVTAGHCSYDWSHSLGRATEVKAYIGYHGNQSVKKPETQFRHVTRIVTTEGWLRGRGAKNFDVSFMQVEKPFTDITPIVYSETPESGEYTIGVVGYPGDLKDDKTGEKGAYMYEMFLETKYDLALQADTMLEYQIDTFGGNSGSPVLRQPKLDSIGAHVYGGTINSASVIGRYGNPYNDYLAGFGVQLFNDGLNIVPVKANTNTNLAPSHFGFSNGEVSTALGPNRRNGASGGQPQLFQQRSYQPTGYRKAAPPMTPSTLTAPTRYNRTTSRYGPESGEEGFLDIMKSALRVGGPLLGGILQTGLPMALGPLGAPIGALAGLALNAASKLAETGDAESFDPFEVQEGTMERAILAEAALTAIQTLDMHPEQEEGIFSDMKDYVMRAAPTIKKVAPRVMGAMMEPALRIALSSLHNYNEKGSSGAEAFGDQTGEPFRLNITYSADIDRPGDRDTEAFVSGLKNAMSHGQEGAFGDQESEEGFFDIISAGVRFAGRGLTTAARVGLPLLAQMMNEGAQESAEADAAAAPTAALSSSDLAKRALVGEAALQALIKLPPQVLEEEGFFDSIADVVKRIAPVVVKVAPSVIGNLSPAIGALFKAAANSKGEATFAAAAPSGRKSLAPKRSSTGLRGGPDGNRDDFLSKVQGWHANQNGS
ncbi:MAG: hypothetical protein Q9173_004607 [Seirophora scorigena]